jgi:hypothetical protein
MDEDVMAKTFAEFKRVKEAEIAKIKAASDAEVGTIKV